MAEEKSPIKIKKIGHVVLTVSDIERSAKFWTEIMGFKFSDKNEIGMQFFRNGTDHHTVALLQAKEKTERFHSHGSLQFASRSSRSVDPTRLTLTTLSKLESPEMHGKPMVKHAPLYTLCTCPPDSY